MTVKKTGAHASVDEKSAHFFQGSGNRGVRHKHSNGARAGKGIAAKRRKGNAVLLVNEIGPVIKTGFDFMRQRYGILFRAVPSLLSEAKSVTATIPSESAITPERCIIAPLILKGLLASLPGRHFSPFPAAHPELLFAEKRSSKAP